MDEIQLVHYYEYYAGIDMNGFVDCKYHGFEGFEIQQCCHVF